MALKGKLVELFDADIADRAFALFISLFAFLVPINKQLSNTALIFSALSFLFLLRKQKVNYKLFFQQQPLAKPLGYFFSALLAAVFFSTNVLSSVHEYIRMITYVLPFLFFAILNFCPNGFAYDLKKSCIHCFMAGCTISGLYAIYQYLATKQLHVTSFYGHHVIFGSFMEVVLPILTVFFIEQSNCRKKALYFFMGLICLVALILTLARGPWLGTAIALFIVIISMKKKLSENKKSMIAGAILIILLLTISSPLYLNRVKTITDPTMSSNYHRLLIWDSTIHMIQDYPLTGVGLGQFIKVYNEQYISPLSLERFHPHAHNSYLMYAAENGLINLLAFFYLLISILKSLLDKKGDPISIAVLATFIAIVVSSFVDSILWAPYLAKILWLFIGLGLYNSRAQDGFSKI